MAAMRIPAPEAKRKAQNACQSCPVRVVTQARVRRKAAVSGVKAAELAIAGLARR